VKGQQRTGLRTKAYLLSFWLVAHCTTANARIGMLVANCLRQIGAVTGRNAESRS
jgi:hypothetical protein